MLQSNHLSLDDEPQIRFCQKVGYVLRYQGYEFKSVFQPIYRIRGDCFGYEALVRITDVDSQFVPPDRFFSAIEDDLETCILIDQWTRKLHFKNYAHFLNEKSLFINVLPNTLIHEYGSAGHHSMSLNRQQAESSVFVEVVESACEDLFSLQLSTHHLRIKGYHIALDDFGSGYSNARRAATLCPDIIKIDQLLLRRMFKEACTLLADAVSYARSINAQIVVEGVETEEELSAMADLGVDYVQGYYLGHPANPVSLSHRHHQCGVLSF
ncbi:EAL domain-containing protein [Thaumasiovibrio subtropicus]|uniref:EAL domain-containing protein n=1 Tax=Thaumasiovibrio subtropicus TaxID=1891207 RepID=UPI00131D5117|nr:EAL domain-containing protein [Thaumasiovibrio subtropicus]